MQLTSPSTAAVISVGLALLLVSCGSTSAVTTFTSLPASHTAPAVPAAPAATSIVRNPTRTPLPTPYSANFPTGRFVHHHPQNLSCMFLFNLDGTYAFYSHVPSLDVEGAWPYATGTYRVSSNVYVETSTDLRDCATPMKYTWTFDGQVLTFQSIGEDACPARQEIYESSLMYAIVE